MMRDDNATSINKKIKALDTESLVQGEKGKYTDKGLRSRYLALSAMCQYCTDLQTMGLSKSLDGCI